MKGKVSNIKIRSWESIVQEIRISHSTSGWSNSRRRCKALVRLQKTEKEVPIFRIFCEQCDSNWFYFVCVIFWPKVWEKCVLPSGQRSVIVLLRRWWSLFQTNMVSKPTNKIACQKNMAPISLYYQCFVFQPSRYLIAINYWLFCAAI